MNQFNNNAPAPGGFPQAPAPQYQQQAPAPGGYTPGPAPAPQYQQQAPAPGGYAANPGGYAPQAQGPAAAFGYGASPAASMFAGATLQEGIDRLPPIALGIHRLQIVKTEWRQRSSSIVVTWKYLASSDASLVGSECAKVYKTVDTNPKAAQKKLEDWVRMVTRHLGYPSLEALMAAGQHPLQVAEQIAFGQKPLDGRVADCNCVFSGQVTKANAATNYAGGEPINNQSWAVPSA